MKGFENQAGHGRYWIYVVCVACLVCVLAVGGHVWRSWRFERRGIERPGQADAERRLGINVQLTQYDADELDRVLSDLHSLDFYWLRQRFPWQAIEPEPGVYDWQRWDALVEAVRGHGFGLIAVLDAPPTWAAPQDGLPLPCKPPCREGAYARFVSAFARRYGEVIDHYQVWDEPNLSQSWGGGHAQPCAYAVLLEAAYPAIHAADPSAWVLGGGLAPTQAPGPDNVNDLTYLQQLYAMGGGASFDILATKPYGFWSGPEDRRVAPDVLNYSRVIALREQMRARGDEDKPVWAVEWGWNALPEGWEGERPPWGSDTASIQRPRILEAIARARAEWPWMGVMCWAEYQPGVPPTDPSWGFALRGSDGSSTALYDVFRVVERLSPITPSYAESIATRWWLLPVLLPAATTGALVLWRRCGGGGVMQQVWQWWSSLSPICHLVALIALALLYAFTPWPEWTLLELALAAVLLYNHPRWALLGAVFSMPLFYMAKPFATRTGVLHVPPSETLLLLAVLVSGLRCARTKRCWRPFGHWSALDVLWALWTAVGVLSATIAPDPARAWHEWRLCMLDPALLYLLLRLEGMWQRPLDGVLLAWVASGMVVALVGIGQWMAGALVHAGGVGRVTSVYFSPNHVALFLERIWPLALALALYGRLERQWRLAAWGSVAVLSIGLYLTYSRGAWLLAVPLALLVMGISYRRCLRWWAVGGQVVAVFVAVISVLQGRLTPLSTLPDEVRIPVWQSTVRMIADRPWTGVGLDGFRFVYPRYMSVEAWTEPLLYHPHNMWLDAAVRLGLPGMVVFALLIVHCVYRAVRLQKDARPQQGTQAQRGAAALYRAVAVGCLAGLSAGLIHGMVDSGYFLVDLAWSLALVAGLVSSTPTSVQDMGRCYRDACVI